jgi:pectate lyase
MPRFRPRIRFNGNISPPDPPDPTPENAGGWADFTGLTTGGTGGTLRTFTNFNALWDALEITDESEPEIFRYTGSNVTLDPVRYQASLKENKTIETSAGQILSRGELRFIEFQNLLIRNLHRKGPYIDRVDSSTQQDYISLSGSTKVWIDHCTFDGERVWEGPSIQFVDGCIDIGPNAAKTVSSNYVTVSNCRFIGVARGVLIGFADSETFDRTFNKVTLRNNLWENVQQRGPRVRFGEVEIRENYYRWTISFPPSGVSNVRNVGVGREAQIYSQNNYYENGDRLFENYDVEAVKLSGLKSVNDFIGTFNTSFDDQIRPENVLWNPNTLEGYYVGTLKTASQARDYVLANAGANLTL